MTASLVPPSKNDLAVAARPTQPSAPPAWKVLIVDDVRSIHDDFRKILVKEPSSALDEAAAALFGTPLAKPLGGSRFSVDSAYQGRDALGLVEKAVGAGAPYTLAFVDVRMPPGWDGVETASRLWMADPDLQVVLCTAYSDYSWDEVAERLGHSDNLLILKKPFDPTEVLQVAHALARKWSLARESKSRFQDLDEIVVERTNQLRETNAQLLQDIAERKQAEAQLEASRAAFKAILDNIPDPCWLKDIQGHILAANEGLARFCNRSVNALLGNTLMDLVPQATERLKREDERVMALRRPIRTEGRMCDAFGNDRWFETVISPVFSSSGQLTGTVGIAREFTERKRIELRLAVFASLGNRLNGAKTVKEAAELIVDVAEQLLGWHSCLCYLYSAEEDVVKHVLNVDIIGGRRREGAPVYDRQPPGPLLRKAIESGPQLVLRESLTRMPPDAQPFGDLGRPSASLLYVPIRNGPEIIGVLSIQSYTPKAYNQQSLETLQALADHCGGALDRIRSQEALNERVHFTELSADVGWALAGKSSLRESLRLCLDSIVSKLGVALARIWTVGSDHAVLELQASAGLEGHIDEAEARIPIGHLKIGKIAAEREPLLSNELQQDPTFSAPEWARQEGIVAFAGYPLLVGEELVGVLALFSRETLAPSVFSGVVGIANQIAVGIERKQTEEALAISEQRLRAVWENSLDGMRLTDREGRIVAVNDAYCKLVQLPREKLVGSHMGSVVKDFSATDAGAYIQEFDRGEVVPRATTKVTLWNSKELDLEISSSFIDLTGNGRLLLAILRDITERTTLEQQLRQSQKMDAIGHLAGGVAHDFNNLLAVIRGNAELALMSTGQVEGDALDWLKEVVAASDRAANLTRQLLAFGRKQLLQPQPLDLRDVVGNLTKMLKRIIGEDIQLQCSYAARLPAVHADAGMVEQVLINLVVNARDAMPRGGKLLVTTEAIEINADSLTAHPESRVGKFVTLSVRDTGTGIAPEHLGRIFEPFFTTKETGKGTGLGLATVYGIVKQHQGWLEVATELGTGTTFTIFLPAFEGAQLAQEKTTEQPRPRGGTETILLVEDDEGVRLLTRRTLESFGYVVHEAASGSEALQLWSTQAGDLDLLLSDMVMPQGVNGYELAEKLREKRADLKVIFMSGYSGDAAGRDMSFLLRTRSHFLQKPCPTRELLQTVRKCLDEA